MIVSVVIPKMRMETALVRYKDVKKNFVVFLKNSEVKPKRKPRDKYHSNDIGTPNWGFYFGLSVSVLSV